MFKSFSDSSRGILKQGRGRCTIHFNGSMNTTLVPKEVADEPVFCGQRDIDQTQNGRNTTLGIFSEMSNWKQVPERVQSFDDLASEVQLTQFTEKKFISYFLLLPGSRTKFDRM